MTATLASLAAILKEDDTIGAITDELNNSLEILKEIEKETLNWTGKWAIFPLRVDRNNSVSAASSSNTPAAGEQGLVQLVVTAQKVYGTTQFQGVTLAAAKNTKGAFAKMAEFEMNGLIDDFRKQMAAFAFTGGPDIGVIWEKKNIGPGNWQYAGRTANIAVGGAETVDIIRLDTYAVVAAGVAITAVSNTTIGLGALNTAAVPVGTLMGVRVSGAQSLLTEKVGTTAAVSAEPFGFLTNLCAPTHFGISRQAGGTTVLRSNFRHCGSGTVGDVADTLQLTDLQNMLSTIVTASSKRPSAFWLSWMQLTSYSSLMVGVTSGNVRVDADSKGATRKADPGYTDFAYAGVPFKCSDVCPNGLIFAHNSMAYKRAVLSDGEWIDFGSGPIQRVDNTDDGTATFRIYYNLMCLQPNAVGLIAGVTLV